MGLLDQLGLPPVATQPSPMPARGGPIDARAAPAGGLTPFDSKPTPPLNLAPHFPVTLKGMTADQIAADISGYRTSLAFARGDTSSALNAHKAREAKLQPDSKAVAVLMKTPADKIAAQIQSIARANPKVLALARRAQGSDAGLAAASAMFNTTRRLFISAKEQLHVAQRAVEAEEKRIEAADLRAKAQEMLEKIEGLFTLVDGLSSLVDQAITIAKDGVSDGAIAGLSMKLLKWAATSASGANRLIAEAQALEAAAKAIDSENIRLNAINMAKLCADLGKSVLETEAAVRKNQAVAGQQANEAEGSFDKLKKSKFDFTRFRAALAQGQTNLDLLEQLITKVNGDYRHVQRYATRLEELMISPGKCQPPHHAAPNPYPDFKPDLDTIRRETVAMKAVVKKALDQVKADGKSLQSQSDDFSEGLAYLRLRQRDWEAYFDKAQTALFSTPEKI